MIAILVSCLLFVFGLICTIPPRKINFISLWLQSFHNYSDHKTPLQDTSGAAASATATAVCNDTRRSSSKIELRDVFGTFDRNNDGFITRQELRESLKNMGISAGEKDVADMVERVDANGDGLIDLDEFCELYDSISGYGQGGDGDQGGDLGHDDLREAFDVFDGNKDGLITVEELGLVLSSLGFTEGKKIEDCKEMIRKVDMDGDGMVNFDEFKKMMRGGLKGIIPLSSSK